MVDDRQTPGSMSGGGASLRPPLTVRALSAVRAEVGGAPCKTFTRRGVMVSCGHHGFRPRVVVDRQRRPRSATHPARQQAEFDGHGPPHVYRDPILRQGCQDPSRHRPQLQAHSDHQLTRRSRTESPRPRCSIQGVQPVSRCPPTEHTLETGPHPCGSTCQGCPIPTAGSQTGAEDRSFSMAWS